MASSQPHYELFGPEEVPLSERTQDADYPLAAFKSFLYNQSDDRQTLSNAIVFWDLLPKYANEKLNQLPKNEFPNAVECSFSYLGQRFTLTQFPGTTRDYNVKSQHREDEPWVRRYPGVKEQAVEIALIKLASEAGGVCDTQQMERRYGVVFSIRQLRRELEAMGHSYNHYQVVEAIDILASADFILNIQGGKAVSRDSIVSSYEAITHEGVARTSPEARWRVLFHQMVARAIESAQYRQFDLSRLCSRKSYGIQLVKRLIFAYNISPDNPVVISYLELQETASGLNFAKTSDGVRRLEQELKRLQKEHVFSHYVKDPISQAGAKGGRPALVDARFTIYPGASLVSEVKAANRRHSRVEQELKLSPRMRKERQLKLTLSSD